MWNSNLISTKRRVWIQCLGVPIHVWKERFFNSLALRFGKCEDIDEETKHRSRLDVGRFRFFVDSDVFLITVLEERFGDLDRGMTLPPQLSALLYSFCFDECSSSDGVSVGGSGYDLGVDEVNGDWRLSDARFELTVPHDVSEQYTPLMNLWGSE